MEEYREISEWEQHIIALCLKKEGVLLIGMIPDFDFSKWFVDGIKKGTRKWKSYTLRKENNTLILNPDN